MKRRADVPPDVRSRLAAELRALSPPLPEALAELTLPTFVLDRHGSVQWQNAAALELLGDRRGSHFTTMVAPESRAAAQAHFTRKLFGTERVATYPVTLLRADGTPVAIEIESVRLENGGEICGVFGVVEAVIEPRTGADVPLTPRQMEVLRLLAAGGSTDSIVAELHLANETVRNHVRSVLRALDRHSRLQAVVRARELGLV